MTYIPAIDSTKCNQQPSYNAVKIKINNPQTNIPEELKDSVNNGIYNAVNIEVNSPSVNVRKNSVYSYPKSNEIVTYDRTGIAPIYNLVSNKTFINADIDVHGYTNKKKKTVDVPPPNVTTPEAVKKAPDKVAFHGLSFKAAPDINVVPAEEIKPVVDIDEVIKNLSSQDYDAQALQLESIAKIAIKNNDEARAYINANLFDSIIDIIQKDTSALQGPTMEQIDVRKKIIINEVVKRQAMAQGREIKESDLPYEISDRDFKLASVLSPLEQAERNKEYGLYTLSALTKVYGEEYEKKTGLVIPLTDLPGASVFADALRKSNNPGVKIAAIDSLMYIRRPEYNREIKAVMQVATHAKNPSVSRVATEALELLEAIENN